MEEIKLYEGKETLFFDPIPHEYFWNDEKLPSATTITKLLTPAAAIGNWTAKMCAEEFKKLIKAGVSYDEIELIKYYDQIKKSANANMSSAGLVGGEVHNLIETYIHTGQVVEVHNEEMKKSFNKFTGTLDALFKNKDGQYIIYDWKTSSGIRDSYYVQIYLYALAIEEELQIKIPKGVIVNCTKEGKLRIAEFDIDSDNHDTALSCLKLYRYLNKKEKK